MARLLLVAALLSAAVSMGVAALPLYLASLGVQGGALLGWNGLAFGAGVGVSALATPLWGALGDRVGRRAMVVRAAAGLALTQLLLAHADGPMAVVALRALQGALSGAMPAVVAHVAGLGSAGRAGRLGRLEAAASAGALLGPALGLWCTWQYGLPAIYTAGGVLALLAIPIALTLPEVRSAAPRAPLASALVAGPVRSLLLLAVAVEAGQQLIELAWPVLLVAHTADPVVQAAVVAAVEGASEVAYLVAAPLLGALAVRRGSGAVLRVSLAVSAACSLLLPLVPSPWWLVPAAAGADGAAAGIHPQLNDRLAAHAPEGRESALLGLGASAVRVGGLLAALLAPILAFVGPAATIWIASAGLIGCAALNRPEPRPREAQT